MCLDGEKNDRVAFQARADYQNHAIGWLHRGYSSLGGGKVVRFPRIWMVYGECRFNIQILCALLDGFLLVDFVVEPFDAGMLVKDDVNIDRQVGCLGTIGRLGFRKLLNIGKERQEKYADNDAAEHGDQNCVCFRVNQPQQAK